MTETEAHSLFQMRTGRVTDFVDFRNMLDEEADLVMRMALDMRQRLGEDKARDRAVENLIGWCNEGPGLGFGKTMTSLAGFVASHRRPVIWAALVGSIRHVVVAPGEKGGGGTDGQHGRDGQDGQDGRTEGIVGPGNGE